MPSLRDLQKRFSRISQRTGETDGITEERFVVDGRCTRSSAHYVEEKLSRLVGATKEDGPASDHTTASGVRSVSVRSGYDQAVVS